MQLWTHHPQSFAIDDTALRVDHRRGGYWTHQAKGFRYPEVARALWRRLGTDQLLWCCTLRGMFCRPTEDDDLVEWEITAPPAHVAAYFSSPVWESQVWGKSDSWNGLVLGRPPMEGHKDINALVAFPLPAGSIKCHGQSPVKHPRR